MGPLDRGVAQVVAHQTLNGADVERGGSIGAHHTLVVDTGTDARIAQSGGVGV